MKTSLATILLILCAVSALAQTPYMDSLKEDLRLYKAQDTQRVIKLANLAVMTAYVRPDSALLLAQEGVALARKLNYLKGEMYCTKAMGEAMWTAGEYSIANELLLQVLRQSKSLGDDHFPIMLYTILSANNRDQATYDEALHYAFEALAATKAKKQLATQEEWALSYLEIGADYEEMGRPDSALYYLKQVQLPEAGNSGYNSFKYLVMGRAYAKMSENALALKFYALCIENIAGTNNYKDVAAAYYSMAKVYQKMEKFDSCIFYAKTGFDAAQKGSFKKGMYENSLLLSELYETEDAPLSLRYFKQATAAKDSMFNLQKTTKFLNAQFNEQIRQQEEAAKAKSYQNKVKMYLLLTFLVFSLMVAGILYRSNAHKQRAKANVEAAYEQLKATQQQLIQSEKMASLGELTAGIAHEIQNPLNFVNNFSEVNNELIEEMNSESDINRVKAIATELRQNNDKITHHGKRADSIVKNMLQHSHKHTGDKISTDINALADEYLRLSFQAMRSKDKSFNVEYKTDFDESIGKVVIVPQDIGRVLLNLFNNAFYAVSKKQKAEGEAFKPEVLVKTRKQAGKIEIIVQDNGTGIPPQLVEKIFQPFFTTKPTGDGTGLGLSLSYDIIKAHGGEIKVETEEGKGSTFIITIPTT